MDKLYSVNQKQELGMGADNTTTVRGDLYER